MTFSDCVLSILEAEHTAVETLTELRDATAENAVADDPMLQLMIREYADHASKAAQMVLNMVAHIRKTYVTDDAKSRMS